MNRTERKEINELFAVAESSQRRFSSLKKELRNNNLIFNIICPFLIFISLCVWTIALDALKPGLIFALLTFLLFNFALFCYVYCSRQNSLQIEHEIKQETKIIQRILLELQEYLPHYLLKSTPEEKCIYTIKLKQLNTFLKLKVSINNNGNGNNQFKNAFKK